MRVLFTAGIDDHDRRLETVVRRMCPHLPLGIIHKSLRKGDIRLNGAKAAPEARVGTGDEIAVWDALLKPEAPAREAVPVPESWILYEGTDLVVINKPSGLLVHRGEQPGSLPREAPLDDRVRARLAPSSTSSLGFRPGPLHRLDRETSGIVVFSRTLVGARTFSAALAARTVKKTYLAVLSGVLKASQEVRLTLTRDESARTTRFSPDGDESVSIFRPLAWANGLTLAEVDLGTGRTHQIRVHAQSLGHPLAGDEKYGGIPTPQDLDVAWLLHAWRLSTSLLPPLTAPLPPRRSSWVEKTFKISLSTADLGK